MDGEWLVVHILLLLCILLLDPSEARRATAALYGRPLKALIPATLESGLRLAFTFDVACCLARLLVTEQVPKEPLSSFYLCCLWNFPWPSGFPVTFSQNIAARSSVALKPLHAIFTSVDGHSGWVSSVAFRRTARRSHRPRTR